MEFDWKQQFVIQTQLSSLLTGCLFLFAGPYKNSDMKTKQLQKHKQSTPCYSKEGKKRNSMASPFQKTGRNIQSPPGGFLQGFHLRELLPQVAFRCTVSIQQTVKGGAKEELLLVSISKILQKKKLFQKEPICIMHKQSETICFCSRGGHAKMHQVSCQ